MSTQSANLQFRDILGNQEIIDHMQKSIAEGRVSHAYLIEGPDGAGKRLLAETFAMALLCEQEGPEPCGTCKSCKQVLGGNQTDLVHVTHDKPKTISVGDIRDQVVADISIRPDHSKYKIYIIDEAEKMNEAAQNALLKTIEEPPEYAVVILLSSSKSALLSTILSRCVLMTMRAATDEEIEAFVMERTGVDAEQASLCAAFAQGLPGKALTLAQSESFIELKESAIRLMKKIGSLDTHEMAREIRRVNDYHMDLTDYLDLLIVWYRDVLHFKATQDPNTLIFKDETIEIRSQAEKITYSGLENIIEAIEKAKERLRANVNYDLTMELLLQTIKDKGEQ